MNIYYFNLAWMSFNIYLAILPVIFSLFLFNIPNKFISIIAGIFWFLYLPNTIYIFTDLHHIIEQWTIVDTTGKLILIVEYAALEAIGLSCFLIAFYPVEVISNNVKRLKKHQTHIIIILNFFLGMTMSLGKFERVNSWDVFMNPQFLINSSLHFLSSFDLLGLGILFGFFTNFFYFLSRGLVKKLYTKWIE